MICHLNSTQIKLSIRCLSDAWMLPPPYFMKEATLYSLTKTRDNPIHSIWKENLVSVI